MYVRMVLVAVYTTLCVRRTLSDLRDFHLCHNDFNLNPEDGVLKEHTFPWLGFVQYIHVATSLPHHSRAPRVVLVQRQFVLGTAIDLLRLPKNYKLGNVVFGDYDRDEQDCGLTQTQIQGGMICPRAYLEIPPLDITPHPEFSRFGVGNSLALVKLIRPMKSHYMLPVCLPSLAERSRMRKHKAVYLIDYISTVPRDFDSERMGKKTLKFFTHRECKRHRMKSKLGSEGVTHVLCSSGCGVRPGAPIITHSTDGRFELMGVAAGGGPCARRSMRGRLNPEPPLYVDVYPFASWIMNVITANSIPRAYPQDYKRIEGGSIMSPRQEPSTALGQYVRPQRGGWNGRTYLKGNLCFRSTKAQKEATFFYIETFEANADPPAKLNIMLKIYAGEGCIVACARVMLPNRLTTPEIEGIGTTNISISFTTTWFPQVFYFSLALSGRNVTFE